MGICLAPSAQAGSVTPEYQGDFIDDPAASVHFTVERRPSKKRLVVFRVENIEVACDDGTSERVSLSPDIFRLWGGGRFAGVRYLNDNLFQSYFEVKGQLRPGGQARGSVLYFADYLDHPSFPPGSELPDCSTFGKRGWSAQRGG
jgi:hypothetical protein